VLFANPLYARAGALSGHWRRVGKEVVPALLVRHVQLVYACLIKAINLMNL